MKNLYQHFLYSFEKNNISSEHRLLVAVSGGVDSMVLCDLLLQTDIKFSIAHCNFQLRGIDSIEDQQFVKDYCNENQIEFFTKDFNVKEFKIKHNASTQMAARELRYDWFKELMNQYNFDFLLTAHHLNDNLETFLINLSRGTGLDGLCGMKIQNNKIFRPLLPYSKQEILNYAVDRKILWREDISNTSTDYVRNKIRHQISPQLNEIHPEFLNNFSKTIQFLQDENQLVSQYIQNLKSTLFEEKENHYSISIEKLKELKPLDTILYHLFSVYGFNFPSEIQKLMLSHNNGEIQSLSHRMIKNRNELLLKAKQNSEFLNEIQIFEDQQIEKPLYLKVSKSNKKDLFAAESLDAGKINFPLQLRKPKSGDVFTPFGMKGSKKLSKFLKDEKYSKLDKENTWLLVNEEDQILYIIGKRINDKFKITEHTHNFLNIYLC